MAAITALLTMRATVNKAKAEATRAEAEAETVRMDNTEHATRILVENIVKPLKDELEETRRYLEAAKREMARFRKAIDTANSCRHSDDCPVLARMRQREECRPEQQPAADHADHAPGNHTGAATAEAAERKHSDKAGKC